MRTTLNIADDLYRELKARAAVSGSTVTGMIEDAVRAMFARTSESSGPADGQPVRLTMVSGNGVRRGIDLNDGASLRDAMDGLDETP